MQNILTRSVMGRAAATGRTVLDTLVLWKERSRQRDELAGLDDFVLKDIGISRSDVLHETRKPFWRD